MIWPELGLILAVYFALALFSIGYNALIAYLEREGYLEGMVSLSVAVGSAVTIGAMAFFNWQFALLTLDAFAASGSPMIIGSLPLGLACGAVFYWLLRPMIASYKARRRKLGLKRLRDGEASPGSGAKA